MLFTEQFELDFVPLQCFAVWSMPFVQQVSQFTYCFVTRAAFKLYIDIFIPSKGGSSSLLHS